MATQPLWFSCLQLNKTYLGCFSSPGLSWLVNIPEGRKWQRFESSWCKRTRLMLASHNCLRSSSYLRTCLIVLTLVWWEGQDCASPRSTWSDTPVIWCLPLGILASCSPPPGLCSYRILHIKWRSIRAAGRTFWLNPRTNGISNSWQAFFLGPRLLCL